MNVCAALKIGTEERAMKRMVMRSVFVLLFVGITTLFVACNSSEPLSVRLENKSEAKTAVSDSVKAPLRIGMGAMITPKEGYVYYQRLKEYIEKKLGQPVQMVDRGNYTEMNRLMETGCVDMAFVCSGPYVEGKEKFGMELLAMPLVKGKPIYYSYIIVPADSPVRRFEDLRGKVFAFADPKSNSGKLVPTYMLSEMNETPETFFSSFKFTYGHDISIHAVADKLVDGAAVDSLIWEYIAMTTPELAAKTKIVAKSKPYGIPPVVVRPGLDPKLKLRLKEMLIGASSDAAGREILRGMMIDRFVPGDDTNYNTIRSINAWLSGHRNK